MRIKKQRNRLLRDVAYGAIGAVIGSYAMKPVTNLLYKHERQAKREREEQLRKEEPFMTLAGRLLEQAGLEVTDARKKRVGMMLHWAWPISWGALYGLLHDRVPTLSRGAGLLFGVAFFLVGDELINAVLGLTPPAKEFPIEAHARGLAGHVAFSAAADGTFRALRATIG